MVSDGKNPHTKKVSEVDPELINTIVIGTGSSYCGNCDKNAFPDEGWHKTVRHDMKEIFVENTDTGTEVILPAEPGISGCGTEWKYMTSYYMGVNIREVCEYKWPQYEWLEAG